MFLAPPPPTHTHTHISKNSVILTARHMLDITHGVYIFSLILFITEFKLRNFLQKKRNFALLFLRRNKVRCCKSYSVKDNCWVVMQQVAVISHRLFGTIYPSHPQVFFARLSRNVVTETATIRCVITH